MTKNISKNIRKYRLNKEMSIQKLAELSGLDNHTIWAIENGHRENPTIDTLTKIANVLYVSIDDILK